MAAFRVVPIWLSGIFPDDVYDYAGNDISGLCRRSVTEKGGQDSMDISGAMEVGLSGEHFSGLGCTVWLWIL
jgi:hypothetical protein